MVVFVTILMVRIVHSISGRFKMVVCMQNYLSFLVLEATAGQCRWRSELCCRDKNMFVLFGVVPIACSVSRQALPKVRSLNIVWWRRRACYTCILATAHTSRMRSSVRLFALFKNSALLCVPRTCVLVFFCFCDVMYLCGKYFVFLYVFIFNLFLCF